MSSFLGWDVNDWLVQQRQASPEAGLQAIEQLRATLTTDDPAWINLSSDEFVKQQWQALQAKPEAKVG